jgi:hypothetical protein
MWHLVATPPPPPYDWNGIVRRHVSDVIQGGGCDARQQVVILSSLAINLKGMKYISTVPGAISCHPFVVPGPKLVFRSTAVNKSENQVISLAGIDSVHFCALAGEDLA